MSGFGLGIGYPVFRGLGRFIFFLLLYLMLILMLVSNLPLFDSLHVSFAFAFSHLGSIFSCPNMV